MIVRSLERKRRYVKFPQCEAERKEKLSRLWKESNGDLEAAWKRRSDTLKRLLQTERPHAVCEERCTEEVDSFNNETKGSVKDTHSHLCAGIMVVEGLTLERCTEYRKIGLGGAKSLSKPEFA
ncbi:hypothetical protein Tco_0327737 [Tanacetum coccineum]